MINWSDYFIYDLVSGRLFNKFSRSPKAKVGVEAGCIQRDGYRRVFLSGKWRAVHRIAWDLNNPKNKLTGKEQVDHIDHDRLNNRPLNLEKKSNADNHKNMSLQRNNKSGIAGVYWNGKERLWYAQIFSDSTKRHIGCFRTLLDAVCARKTAERQLGFHDNHGR